MSLDTNTGMRGKISFVLIGCERNGQYRSRKKDCVRRDSDSLSSTGNQWLEVNNGW